MAELPHLTVATVVCREDRYLMVKERSDGVVVYNQPAGHVEPDETVLAAAVRETLEETAWQVRLEALLGIYHYHSKANGISYVRACFIAEPESEDAAAELDEDILEASWLTLEEICRLPLRSPIVLRAIEDHQAGIRYPLAVINP